MEAKLVFQSSNKNYCFLCNTGISGHYVGLGEKDSVHILPIFIYHKHKYINVNWILSTYMTKISLRNLKVLKKKNC